MRDDLIQAITTSDSAEAGKWFKKKIKAGEDPWNIHLALFPVVQQVLNPPYINPHLPKMYAIYREFLPYLKKEDISPLVNLEINEYAKRAKLDTIPRQMSAQKFASFSDIESAISYQDVDLTAIALSSFYEQVGGEELARRLLLIGSDYLNNSLGHSISCTAFIFLEMLQRKGQDLWPALGCLSDYFCKGGFHTAPTIDTTAPALSEDAYNQELLRAASGGGIVNVHHTITLYSIERGRHLVTKEEYQHMLHAWIAFMGPKPSEPITSGSKKGSPFDGYDRFLKTFSRLDAEPVLYDAMGMIETKHGRNQLSRYLIKGIGDLYQGDYNPHYLTGLGSTLWVIDKYWNEPTIVATALFQFLDFFFSGIL